MTKRVTGATYAHQTNGNAMQAQHDEVLTIDEWVIYLKFSKSTLYKLVQEVKVLGQKVSKHWRFHRDMIESWLGKETLLKRKTLR